MWVPLTNKLTFKHTHPLFFLIPPSFWRFILSFPNFPSFIFFYILTWLTSFSVWLEKYGVTALWNASTKGHIDILDLLLEENADVNFQNRVCLFFAIFFEFDDSFDIMNKMFLLIITTHNLFSQPFMIPTPPPVSQKFNILFSNNHFSFIFFI